MDSELSSDELCEITSAGAYVSVAQCTDGLGCSVYAGGKELPPWASHKVEELVGDYTRGKAVITTRTATEYFILKRDQDTEEFTVISGPLNADELREALYNKS